MKYLICEGIPDGKYNAQSKARNDAEKIIANKGFERYYIPTKYGVQTIKILKWKQWISYKKNYKIWKKYINRLQKNDVILIQYPLINTISNFHKMINYCNQKGIITICLIHDMDSLRFTNMPRKIKEDRLVLNNMKYIIAHNLKMKLELIRMGNSAEKIIELGIFDYLLNNELKEKSRMKNQPVIIAGNLSKEKAKYIASLKDIKNTSFNLYGKGYEKDDGEDNVFYKGAFLPEELPNILEGSFGLVWDGNSKDACVGGFGNYMKYNNPHKTSLYIASEIPIIVWNQAAISDFVEDNKIGITIGNLTDIKEKINNLSDEEYDRMKSNVKMISKKIQNGEFLSRAIDEIEIISENEMKNN